MSAGRIVLESMYNAASTTLEREGVDKTFISEMMDGIRFMLQREDAGWVHLYGNQEQGDALAITLDDLKRWEQSISEMTIGAAWLKRGLSLRHGYVWAGGIRYGDIPAGGSQGVRNIKKFYNDVDNQRNFFGNEARRRREARLYYSGIALYLGDDRTKKLTPLPLRQITDQILSPDGTGDIWAYKREWSERDIETGEVKPRKSWIFTNRAIGKRVKRIKDGNEWVPVSQTERIFDLHANRLDGMAYGTPDALAASAWHNIAKGAFLDGSQMTAALASIAFQVTNKSNKGGQNASLQMASARPAGSTAVVGQNELQSITTAGKAYEFEKLTSLLAVVATSLDVSVIHLSSAPGDAGSSYSAASSLDLPSKLTMAARRALHVDFDKEVLRWFGVVDPDVFFPPFDGDGTETYRLVQAIVLELNAGAYSVQEARDRFDDLHGLPNGKAPVGALEYNNIESEKLRAEITASTTTSDDEPTSSTASPNQGVSDGTGGDDSAGNDIRSDTID